MIEHATVPSPLCAAGRGLLQRVHTDTCGAAGALPCLRQAGGTRVRHPSALACLPAVCVGRGEVPSQGSALALVEIPSCSKACVWPDMVGRQLSINHSSDNFHHCEHIAHASHCSSSATLEAAVAAAPICSCSCQAASAPLATQNRPACCPASPAGAACEARAGALRPARLCSPAWPLPVRRRLQSGPRLCVVTEQ